MNACNGQKVTILAHARLCLLW